MNTTSTSFPALVITTVEYLKSEHDPAQVHFLFPSVLYGSGVIKTVEQALEFIFRQCNRVDGTEWISSEEFQDCYSFPVRSLSVGDVVRFIGSGGFRACYVCESLGWQEITSEEANWLVKHITPRDFWFSFKETVNRSNLD